MRASMRSWLVCNRPYGTEMRSIGACFWMYSPLRSRSELEVVVGDLAGEESPGLVAKLRDALFHEPLIDRVVAIHGGDCRPPARGG